MQPNKEYKHSNIVHYKPFFYYARKMRQRSKYCRILRVHCHKFLAVTLCIFHYIEIFAVILLFFELLHFFDNRSILEDNEKNKKRKRYYKLPCIATNTMHSNFRTFP